MDQETRELLGNIVGLLEIMKKDIKGLKQDLLLLNTRLEGANSAPRFSEGGNQPIKAMDAKTPSSSVFHDQFKMSRLK